MQLKGLILAGGAGTRLRPLTHSSAKQLVPVANKPVLFYGIEAMRDAGIDDITIVVSPGQGGSEIRERAGDGSRWGLRIGYVVQEQALGLAHAVLTGEEAIGDSPFVVYLGDNLLQGGITGMVEQFKAAQPDALILLQHVDDPRAFGVAELDGEVVVQLEEKPAEPKSDLALVGVYMFMPGIFQICRALEPSGRGEYEITEAIQTLIDQGKRVEPHVVTGWWKDTGKWEDMLETNRLLLDVVEPVIDGEVADSDLDGRVAVAAGSAGRALPHPGAGRNRRGRGAAGRLHRAVHGGRRGLRDRAGRDRELDHPGVREDQRPPPPARGLAHRSQRRHRRPELEAERLPDPRGRRLAHRDPVIDGVQLIPLRRFEDERGWFMEIRRESTMPNPTRQTNVSFTRAGVIRGLHYHEGGQDDLFVCLRGMVRVVLLDRESGDTYSVDIGDDNPVAVYVPGRLAHGFEALTDAIFCYEVTEEYNADDPDEHEVPWNDPRVRHLWSTQSPILSQRDASAAAS